MPFKSEAQRRFMWAKHPVIARRWAHEPGGKRKLPARKGGGRSRRRRR